MTLYNQNLKLAVQKEGRLTDETLDFLRKSGLEFETYKRRLFSKCLNFPLEIIYARDDDIPDYVVSRAVDLGIVGQNLLNELRPQVKKILNLRFGFCSMVIAVPKESNIKKLSDLRNKKIATSFPNSTRNFFKERDIKIDVLEIQGSVEVTPALGIAAAIVDLVSTGSTLTLNDLKILGKIYDSEAVLICNRNTFKDSFKRKILENLLTRFKAVLSASGYKQFLLNFPRKQKIKVEKIIPGLLKSLPEENGKILSLSGVIKEDYFWTIEEKLRKLGVEKIIITPIEKIIT